MSPTRWRCAHTGPRPVAGNSARTEERRVRGRPDARPAERHQQQHQRRDAPRAPGAPPRAPPASPPWPVTTTIDTRPNGVDYDASAITVLEGLEAVRKRPGMYVGSTGERGLQHLVYEACAQPLDEA